MTAPGIWPPSASPFPLQAVGYGGVYGTKRSLDRWKYRSRPARTTLNGAILAGAANLAVNGQQFFPQSGTFPITWLDGTGEIAYVVIGAGTNNWIAVRGVNGTTAQAHANGAVVVGKSWYDVLCVGDSTVQCSVQGTDGWVERFRRALQVDVGGGGALLGAGFFPLWRCGAQVQTLFGLPSVTNAANEWAFAGTWAQPAQGSTTDLMLFNGALQGTAAAANIATFTIPPYANVTTADVFYVNTAASGVLSVSLNGGAFANIPGTGTGAQPTMLYTNIAIPAGTTTVAVRCADAAGVGHVGLLCGIKLWSVTPTFGVTTGIMVHNCGQDGQVLFGNAVPVALDRTNASGDNYGFLNGHPGSLFPDLVVVGPFSNDVGLTPDANIATHLQTLLTRCLANGDVLGMTCSEQDRRSLPTTLTTTAVPMGSQRNTNLAQRAVFLTNNCAVIDVYEAFQAEGDNGFFASNTDGLMFDTLHWSALGCADVAARVARILLGGF